MKLSQTPKPELIDKATEHYNQLSKECSDYNSVVIDALKWYKKTFNILNLIEDEIRYMKPDKKSNLAIENGALVSKGAVLKILEGHKK